MADTKITALTAITTVDPANDVLPIVDVSDTSMAASGTTKKITTNQILGASGTATLASATITGDLTVDTSTLKVNSTANRVGVLTASPESELDVRGLIAVRGTPTFPSTGVGIESYYSAANTSSFIQSYDRGGGAFANLSYSALAHIWQINGGESMRLNSTGLGVGVTPSAKLHINGDFRIEQATTPVIDFYTSTTKRALIKGTSSELNINSLTSNPITFTIDTTERARIDASGNLLVGTVSPLSSVSGSSQIALGGAGIQTTSQAISAATATTICRSGSGGVAIVAGYNGTGQYSAIVLFKYGGTSTSVVGSINDTGSTITYAISGANLQITSSLALTNLTVTCIRTA